MAQAPQTPVPADAVSLGDYERYARERIPVPVWAYIAGAAADGLTRDWNRRAFDRIALSGRVLADMRGAHTRGTLLGLDMPAPLLIAPTAFHRLVHPEGEAATALGAAAAGVCLTLGTLSSIAIEEVAAARHGPLWFQLYMQRRREDTLRLVRRAEDAGCLALVVTVDAPVSGIRNDEQRAGFALPAGVFAANLVGIPPLTVDAGPGESPVFRGLLDGQPTWADIAWLRGETRLPIVLKGILNPLDAAMALEHGVDAVAVSNHGGRTLDTLPATIDALPAIVAAVGGRVPVLLDGGVRRGTDILKALARGASAVMIGQPVLHALAVAGPVGVAHLFSILRAELEAAMALTGCRTLADISPDLLIADVFPARGR